MVHVGDVDVDGDGDGDGDVGNGNLRNVDVEDEYGGGHLIW